LEGPINETLTGVKSQKDFISVFTFFSFLFLMVVSVVFFLMIAFYFATSFCDITFLFTAPCCISLSLLSCLQLLVARGYHRYQKLHVSFIIFACCCIILLFVLFLLHFITFQSF